MSFGAPQAIDRLFPDAATIYTGESSFDEEGTEEREFMVLATDVPALLGRASGGEVRTGEGSFVVREDQIVLYGWYPEVNEASLLEIDGRQFHVRGVLKGSYGIRLGDRGWTICSVEERDVVEEALS